VIICLFLALVAGMATARVMVAQTGTADLSSSTISVSKGTVVAGDSLQYSVVIRNSGDTAVNDVVMTNVLPAEVTYQAGSLTVDEVNAATITYDDSGNTVTWTGNIEGQGSVTINYIVDVASTITPDDMIENVVQISGTDQTIERAASTAGSASYFQILPMVFKPVPTPALNVISGPSASSNSWTLSWSQPITDATAYQLQESHTTDFSNATTYDLGNVSSHLASYTASFNNVYCYRVRAIYGSVYSDWSNVQCAVGNYSDDLSNSGSGWAIRQQDTDDTNNSSYYQNGEYVVKIGGRWDYALASPLAQAPKAPYAIESRITFDPTVDNLHGYGIVFGGNWNGQPCVAATIGNCFTHYYRFLVVWYGPQNSFRIQLKRIDYNDAQDNIGRGVGLVDFRDISVGNSKGYNTWRIEVDADGSIRIYLNGTQVASAKDATYVNNSPYFGIMASSDEYLGAEPHLDWYRVTKR
ncbi:MAG: DUF11 domain-containing protein, partial [Anaerolineales bacterium]|nr:DUF11 domain-containing protein [Anaerolineales bacterium]